MPSIDHIDHHMSTKTTHMLHMHIISANDDALNAVIDAHGSYSAAETTRFENDGDVAQEIRAGRIAPMHPEVEATHPLEPMVSR